MDVHQAVQFVLDEIASVDDPVLRAELLLTLRGTTDSGFASERARACYQMKAAGMRLSDIAAVMHYDESWVSKDIRSYAAERGLPTPKRVPGPEEVWRRNLRRGDSPPRSTDAPTRATS